MNLHYGGPMPTCGSRTIVWQIPLLRTAALLIVLFLTTASPAQEKEPVPPIATGPGRLKISDARVGFTPGKFNDEQDSLGRGAHYAKRNTWAPLHIDLEVEGKFDTQVGAELRIQAVDADDVKTHHTVPLLKTLLDRRPGEKLRVGDYVEMPFVKSGDMSGEVEIVIYSDGSDNRSPRPLSDPFRVRYVPFREAGTYCVVALGQVLPGFDLPKDESVKTTGKGALRNGRVETATVRTLREMPDRWFGWQAADLVVLGTGGASDEFLGELFDPQRSQQNRERREALLQWVRQGGKLVISLGAKSGIVSQYEPLKSILPAVPRRDDPVRNVGELSLKWSVPGAVHSGEIKPKTDLFPITRFAQDRMPGATTLLPSEDEIQQNPQAGEIPVVIQAPYGMGRITVVGFDLDRSPFLDFPKKAEFWDWLLRECGSTVSAAVSDPVTKYMRNPEDELLAKIRTRVDDIEGVPVISFGWVALFIALYTLLIGPVEYFALKKLTGRLEWTWITFPIIVISVSAAAYFTAYAIKGRDLLINKIDIVDYDLNGRVHGKTWFTLFSPRIDSYTIGVEPGAGWGDAEGKPLVDWMGGTSSGGGGGLVSRSYSYSSGEGHFADGLVRVPIQVWSTKSFTADWTARVADPSKLFVSTLRHPPGEPTAIVGDLTFQLPVKRLEEATLLYAGKAYRLGDGKITSGETIRISALGGDARLIPEDSEFFRRLAPVVVSDPYTGVIKTASTSSRINLYSLLFHEKAVGRNGFYTNASLRELDSSWRVDERRLHEAVLVGRLEEQGETERLMTEPNGASPTKLWLKSLPGGEEKRDAIPGRLRQETVLRVTIPIAPPETNFTPRN